MNQVFLKKCGFYSSGVVLPSLGVTTVATLGSPEPLRHGFPPAYNSLVIQVLSQQISTIYLQKYGFYGLGVVLLPLGAASQGAPGPLRHEILPGYYSKASQVPTNLISATYLQKCGFYDQGLVLGLLRPPRGPIGALPGRKFW